jgi:hypothetical protein
MAYLTHTNRGYSTIAGDINNTDDPVTFSVGSGHGARFPAAGTFNVSIYNPVTPDTREIIAVTSRTTDSMTGTRAAEGTSKIAHTAGDVIQLNITSALLDAIESAINGKMATASDAAAAVAAIAAAGIVVDLSPQLGGDLDCNDFLVGDSEYHDYGTVTTTLALVPGTDGQRLKATIDNAATAVTITDNGSLCHSIFLILIHHAGDATTFTPTWNNGGITVYWGGAYGVPVLDTDGGRYMIVLQRISATEYWGEWNEYTAGVA